MEGEIKMKISIDTIKIDNIEEYGVMWLEKLI